MIRNPKIQPKIKFKEVTNAAQQYILSPESMSWSDKSISEATEAKQALSL